MGSNPRLIFLDIETFPIVGYTWDRWDTSVIAVVNDWELASFAYKEPGKKPVCLARCDFSDKTDRSLAKALWDLFDSADVIVAHNGDRFDVPKVRAKLVEHGFPPPTPFRTVDTRKIARSQFRFSSNALDDLARVLKIGRKMQTGGFELWRRCMAGDAKAWATMKRYNVWDVVLLEQVYDRLKAWYPTHPNLSLHADKAGCPVCMSPRVQRRGYQVLRTSKRARFQCQQCAHWFSVALGDAA